MGRGRLTICLTTSEDECKSINRLWIRISYLSQVLEPSPQGLRESENEYDSPVGQERGRVRTTFGW